MTAPTGDALRAAGWPDPSKFTGLSPSEEFDQARRERHKQQLAEARTELTIALENVRMGYDTVGAVDAIQRLFEVMMKGPK